MKIKLDENLAARSKAVLEAAGHDVKTGDEQKLSAPLTIKYTRSAVTRAES